MEIQQMKLMNNLLNNLQTEIYNKLRIFEL